MGTTWQAIYGILRAVTSCSCMQDSNTGNIEDSLVQDVLQHRKAEKQLYQ